MSDTNTPQYPDYPPMPPQPGATAGAYPQPYIPQPPRERSRHGWVWALVVLVVVFGILGSCVWSVSLLGKSTKGGAITTGEAIAVIPIDGVIAGSGTAGVVTPEDFLDQLDQAERDNNVKAIVLRVDSPGGTVAASEEIATYVKQSKKPIVVTVGDVGASGAYMVASQSDRIFALPGSAVGSIGVITDIPNVSGLLDTLGVKFTVVKAGKYKDAGSPYRALTKEETSLIQGSVNEVYGQFIDVVAEGRKMPRSEVESLATGWAWNGEQAKELGLVDEIGTYRDAMRAAAKLGGIDGEYETVTYGNQQFEDLLNTIMGVSGRLAPLGSLDPRGVTQPGPALAK
jgi:protease IV